MLFSVGVFVHRVPVCSHFTSTRWTLSTLSRRLQSAIEYFDGGGGGIHVLSALAERLSIACPPSGRIMMEREGGGGGRKGHRGRKEYSMIVYDM